MTEYYLDQKNGDDSKDGTTWKKAKKTLAAVEAIVKAGDTVNVAGGSYPPYVPGMTTDNGLLV